MVIYRKKCLEYKLRVVTYGHPGRAGVIIDFRTSDKVQIILVISLSVKSYLTSIYVTFFVYYKEPFQIAIGSVMNVA